MTCFSSFFAIIWQKMKKNKSWKFTDESSITFQSSVSGPGEFGLSNSAGFLWILVNNLTYIGIIFCTIRGPPVQNLYSSLFTLVCCVHDSCPLHCMVDQDGCWRSIDPNLSSLFWLNMYVICICFVVGIGIREGHRLISCK